MNIRLVIVWVVAILLFAGMGIFGFVNRDLNKNGNVGTQEPVIGDAVTHSCRKVMENGISTYVFYFNFENKIDKVDLKYAATSMNIDAYTSATILNNSNVSGVKTSLNGSASDFTFTMNVDFTKYDKDSLDNLRENLNSLSFVVNGIVDYETYKIALNNIDFNSVYSCD